MSCAKYFVLFVIAAASITWQVVCGVDRTLVPGEQGADVVRAVISKIVFSNISFMPDTVESFMRTMAYVESGDGMQRNSQGGGIWNISRDRFDYVKSELLQSNPIIIELGARHQENHIRLMDWDSIVYANLTIPLYSGLFTRLLIHINPVPIPPVEEYDHYWCNVFKSTTGDTEKWIVDARDLTLDEDEECTVDTDLVFVLDESGSIQIQNFQLVKNFVYNFSRELLITDTPMNNSRVGVITFDNDATEQILLNSTFGSAEVLRQISQLPYNGGGTNTAEALELMRQQSWRNEISVLRLAIVITDGRSNNRIATMRAAQAVHNHIPPIAVYAIGVGRNIDENELQTIASRPETYSHLDSFASSSLHSVGVSYSYQICFTESQDVDLSEEENGNLERGATARLRYVASVAEGMTFRLCVRNGGIILYASTIPNPSSAQYGWRDTVAAAAHSIRCSTLFYDLTEVGNTGGNSENNGNDNNNNFGRRKRRQILSDSATVTVYVTLEGQDDMNEFSFNSSMGNVTLDENECEEEPCDYPNAECVNTDGGFYCMCSEGYSGNGTLCSEIITPTVPVMVVKRNNIAAPIISVILIVITTAIIIIIFAVLVHYYYNVSLKKNKEDEYQLTHHMEECEYESDDEIKEDEYQITMDFETESKHDKITNENEHQPITSLLSELSNDNCDGEPGELLKVDEDMFSNRGPQRFVPTMVEKFEKMAAGVEDDQATQKDNEGLEEPGITKI